jgi:hypothetical protein
MSNHKKGQSTGPKTQAGKAVASKNARKASIFTKGYLPSENIQTKQEEFLAMVEQWRAHDPSRQLILLTVDQAKLGIERMMLAERAKIEGLMVSVTVASKFCLHAGLVPTIALKLPAWFFLESGLDDKRYAKYVVDVYDQAEELKRHYSDQLASQVQNKYPDLYRYVLTGYKEGSSFLSILGHRYKQSIPSLNLANLMNELKDDYECHFLWMEGAERYQIIINGLRAEQMLEALDLDKSTRYATNFQNRIIKGFTTLAAMDQHEALLTNQSNQVALPNSGSQLLVEEVVGDSVGGETNDS